MSEVVVKRMRIAAAFFCLLLLAGLPRLFTSDGEPLTGGLFTEDLTVDSRLHLEGAPVGLEAMMQEALRHNLEILTARVDRGIEHDELSITKSIYDAQFELNAAYEQDKQEQASQVFGERELHGEVGVSLKRMFLTGTTLTLEGKSMRESSASPFITLSRHYKSLAAISVEQPLLRNFFGVNDRRSVQQTRLDIRKFDFETLDRIEASILEVRKQYWELKLAHRTLLARRKGLRKAQDFYQITHDKLDIGLTEKPDVFAAEANVRTRVIQVLQAENTLRSASHSLQAFLGREVWTPVVPVEEPDMNGRMGSYEREFEQAMESRRDLRQKELEIENQRLEMKIRGNERLPELTFEGRYATTGLDRKLGASQTEVFGYDHPQYYAGFILSTPVENREARAVFRQASKMLRRLEYEKRQIRIEIAREVDDAYRMVRLASIEVKQKTEIEDLQRKKLEEEEKNFNLGRSESKTIIDFQEDLIQAEIDAVDARIQYAMAIDEFYRAGHRLLEHAGLTRVEDDLPLHEGGEQPLV